MLRSATIFFGNTSLYKGYTSKLIPQNHWWSDWDWLSLTWWGQIIACRSGAGRDKSWEIQYFPEQAYRSRQIRRWRDGTESWKTVLRTASLIGADYTEQCFHLLAYIRQQRLRHQSRVLICSQSLVVTRQRRHVVFSVNFFLAELYFNQLDMRFYQRFISTWRPRYAKTHYQNSLYMRNYVYILRQQNNACHVKTNFEEGLGWVVSSF